MAVRSVVTINRMRIQELQRAQIVAAELTGEAIHTDLVQSQVMPFDEGTLQNDSTFVDCSESNRGHVSIVSSTPYARRLYYHPEYDFSKDENPNAGGRWLDQYLPGGDKEDFAVKAYRRFYRREAGL